MITQECIKEILSYNPDTGVFTWKRRPLSHFKTDQAFKRWNTLYSCNIAGCLDGYGYPRITINNKDYKSHRLAWLYVYGEWPKNQIDHINQNKLDNRIINLRDVTDNENKKNMPIMSSNKSGAAGVHKRKANNKWQAYINCEGKRINLGSFDSFEQARAVRLDAEIKHGFVIL